MDNYSNSDWNGSTHNAASHASPGRRLAFVLLGSLVGAGVALLLAPYSGRESRRRLANASRSAGHQVKSGLAGVGQKLMDVRQRAGHGMAELKNDVSDAVAAGRSAADRYSM